MQGLISILLENPLLFAVITLALLFSVTIHEFSHAYVANLLGDPTAKNLGRMTLNPVAHIDPLGALTLLLVGFGWGKAVPVNYYNFKNPKRDAALVSLAGPGSNFILALVLTACLKIVELLTPAVTSPTLSLIYGLSVSFLYTVILYNIFLGLFNLLPVEPLDGFKIVNGILPPSLSVQWVQLAPYGIFILLFLVITDTASSIISPVARFIINILRLG